MRSHNVPFQILSYIVVLGLALFSRLANAGETRLLVKMPTADKTTAGQVTKSKKPGFECQHVVQGPSGNPIKVKGSKSAWFVKVSDTESDAADDLLASGKRAVRCNLKMWSKEKHRMANAEVDEAV